MTGLDLTDDATRAALTARLGEHLAGRPVLLGPSVLAAYTGTVPLLRTLGCPVLVVSTARGAGPVPDAGSVTVIELETPPTASMTDEVRVLDRVARTMPADVVAAIEDFDPGREGVWVTPPFVLSDEPLLGRPVLGGRPARWVALEDKMLVAALCGAAGVPTAPSHVVPTDGALLRAAAADLVVDPRLGTVWSGDARDGVNGGGNFVRWVVDDADANEAFAFFAPRCDRVRVMPFLDGVPCSVHGVVLPSGTAAFRPVEMATLRDTADRRFVYGGLSTWWDPPAADREAMRDAVRRLGAVLAAEHGYRGAFGIDGVLTADGFLPTEINPRYSGGVAAIGRADPDLMTVLQMALLAGHDPGLTSEELETFTGLLDARRVGKPVAVGPGESLGTDLAHPVRYVEGRVERADAETGSTLVCADNPSGFFAKIDPCELLAPGDRLAPLNAALLAHLDREHGTSFGDLTVPPELR